MAQSTQSNEIARTDAPAALSPRVAVIEDYQPLRRALVFQLGSAGLEVTPCSAAREFLDRTDVTVFDCIVVDLFLPRMNGLQLQAELRSVAPFTSVVFISGHGDLSLAIQAMRKGALDFFEKPIDDQALLSSIIRGIDLTRTRRTEHARRIEIERRLKTLTPREREVFALVTSGLLNKQVGAELGTTERTVKAHRERLVKKMGAASLAELVRMAGILELHSTQTQSA